MQLIHKASEKQDPEGDEQSGIASEADFDRWLMAALEHERKRLHEGSAPEA